MCEQVSGVVDCIPDVEKSGLLCRQEHLGFDRHGRKYWFLARRIFVYVHRVYIYIYIFLIFSLKLLQFSVFILFHQAVILEKIRFIKSKRSDNIHMLLKI